MNHEPYLLRILTCSWVAFLYLQLTEKCINLKLSIELLLSGDGYGSADNGIEYWMTPKELLGLFSRTTYCQKFPSFVILVCCKGAWNPYYQATEILCEV